MSPSIQRLHCTYRGSSTVLAMKLMVSMVRRKFQNTYKRVSAMSLKFNGGSLLEVVSCCEGEWAMREGGMRRRRAVSGGGDGLVKLWDLQDGRELLSMAGHTAEVVCVGVLTPLPS